MPDTLYELSTDFKSKHFRLDNVNNYVLSLLVSNNYIKVSYIDSSRDICVMLMTYQLNCSNNRQRIIAIVELFKNNPLFTASSCQCVILCIDNAMFTLVPQQIFNLHDQELDYLNFVCDVGKNSVLSFLHSDIEMVTVFAIDELLLNWFKSNYKNTPKIIIHQASSLIQGIRFHIAQNKTNISIPKVFIFIDDIHVSITVFHSVGLLYHNRFLYTSDDELLYNIVTVINMLKLDTTYHKVTIWGILDKNSAVYKKIHSYIKNIRLMNKPDSLWYREEMKKSIVSIHFDALSSYLCLYTS